MDQEFNMKINKILYNFIILLLIVVSPVLAVEKELGQFEGIGRFIPITQEGGPGVGPESAPQMLETIMSVVVGFLTILSGLYFFVMFIIGGLGWASAGGDSGKVEAAKNRMTNGVIGLIIVVAAYSVIYIVGKVLGFSILEPAAELVKIGPQ
jgi:hypothetical protein